LMYGIPNS